MAQIAITPGLAIEEDEIVERFVRAQGPGGQHVNKSSSAVELRFDVRGSPSLSEATKARLERLAGARLTNDGVLILFAQAHSAQQLNREDARARLFALLVEASKRPKIRRPTKPTLGSRLRRLEGKTHRSGVKAGRGRPARED